MYKVSSDRRQTTLHRGRPSDWVNGEENLTAEQKLHQSKDGIKIIESRLKGAQGDERSVLLAEKLKTEQELSALKKSLNLIREERVGYDEIFVHLAREILPKVQFEMVRNAALREFDLRKKRATNAALTAGKCE